MQYWLDADLHGQGKSATGWVEFVFLLDDDLLEAMPSSMMGSESICHVDCKTESNELRCQN